MDLDLGQDVEFNVKYRGETHVMTEPTVAQIEKYRDNVEVVPFLVEMGLPEEFVRSLPISKVELLVKSITESISKKK